MKPITMRAAQEKTFIVLVLMFLLIGAPLAGQEADSEKPQAQEEEQQDEDAQGDQPERSKTPAIGPITAGGQKSADEIAKELSNPTAAVMGLGSNFDYKTFEGNLPGADDQSSFTYLFQPGFPFPQSNGYNLLFRPAVPVVFDQPLFNPLTEMFEDSGTELLDIGFDLAYGTTKESGFLYFFGLVGNIPASTSSELRGLWAFGPEVALGKVAKWGVYGALITHQWDVEGGSGRGYRPGT